MERLSPNEWKILRELKRGRKHWTRLITPKGSASSALSKLVRKGLVKRVDQGYYELTEKGKEVLDKSCPKTLLFFLMEYVLVQAEEFMQNPSEGLIDDVVKELTRKLCPPLYQEIRESAFCYNKSFMDCLRRFLTH